MTISPNCVETLCKLPISSGGDRALKTSDDSLMFKRAKMAVVPLISGKLILMGYGR
jgi:hypothetical protein